MERRVRPVAHASHQAVLEWIVPAIFNMTCVVGFISDQVLPEPVLPDASLVALDLNYAAWLVFRERLRKPTFYQAPACGEVVILGW